MHKNLQRQLRKYVGSVDPIPEEWKRFVEAVDEAYHQADADRALLEHSLDLTSQELLERSQQLQQQMAAQQEQAGLVEEQTLALLDAVQSVALGDLDVEVEVPEGIEALSDLAVGIGIMVDDFGAMLAQQEQARVELERSRQQLEEALAEILAVQRRYLREQWQDYTAVTEASRGYFRSDGEEGPTDDAWLPAMTAAIQQAEAVVWKPGESEPEGGTTLAFPIRLYDEVIGAVGFSRERAEPWSEDEITAVETVIEQVAWALENQRLFDEEQQARSLLGMRVNELDCLNDIGREIDRSPPVPELLPWVAGRIPSAMQYPDLCVVAIEFEGNVYGSGEAMQLPHQMVQSLDIRGQRAGRVTIAYTEARDFLDEESALLGDVARRVSGYIENRRLLRDTQARAEELAVLNEMARALTAMLDVDAVLENLYLHASRLLDTTNFYVALYKPELDEISFPLAFERGERMPWLPRRAGRGLTEYIISTREPLLLEEDIATRLAERGIEMIGAVAQSWLGVPMVIGDQVLGVIAVQSYTTPRLYGERHRDLLAAIASQAAIAIQNTRLLEETRAALAEVETVHRSYLRRGWQEYLRQREMLQRSGFLYDSAQAERPEDAIPAPDLWRPEMELALEKGGPAAAKGDEESERRTGVAVPITVRGQTLGVLGVEAPAGDLQWTEDDLALIEAVSDQLGQTLESARLFSDTQRRAERERLISEITAKIRASTDIQTILETTATELGQALGTSRAMVRLGFGDLNRQPGRGDPTWTPLEGQEQTIPEPDGDEGQEVGHET